MRFEGKNLRKSLLTRDLKEKGIKTVVDAIFLTKYTEVPTILDHMRTV